MSENETQEEQNPPVRFEVPKVAGKTNARAIVREQVAAKLNTAMEKLVNDEALPRGISAIDVFTDGIRHLTAVRKELNGGAPIVKPRPAKKEKKPKSD